MKKKQPIRVHNAGLRFVCTFCEDRKPRMYQIPGTLSIVCGRCPESIQYGERKREKEAR